MIIGVTVLKQQREQDAKVSVYHCVGVFVVIQSQLYSYQDTVFRHCTSSVAGPKF